MLLGSQFKQLCSEILDGTPNVESSTRTNGPVAAASRKCSELLLNGVPVQDVATPAVLP
jgi:hypothetical protein